MLSVSPVEIVAVTVIVGVGACIQGSIGFGWAMVAAPFIVLIEPDFVPGPMILSGILLVILMTWRERRSIDRYGVWWMTSGSVPGIAGAWVVLTTISITAFSVVFSLLVLLAVLMSAIGFSVMLTNRNLFIAGLLSGFMGTVTSIGGPPVALIYQNSTGSKLRGTLSAFFFMCASLALIALLVAGWLGVRELKLALLLIPGLIIGFVVSRITSDFLGRYSLRPIILSFSACGAIAVLVRASIG